MKDLQQAFRVSAPMAIEALHATLMRLGTDRDDSIASLRRIAHQLRSAASSFGFPAIAESAGNLEDSSDEEFEQRGNILLDLLHQIVDETEETEIRVLIIEDDPLIAELISRTLAAPNREFYHAENAEKSLVVMAGSTPDLIILDLVLPDRDGRSLLMEFRNNTETSRTPIIVLSAKEANTVRSECLLLGADDFLEKPFDRDILRSTVARMFSQAAARKTSTLDPLTNLPDIREIRHSFDHLQALASRTGHELCVALINIDHFGEWNERLGPLKADQLLIRFADLLRSRVRVSDTVGKWEGDGFILILSDTPIEGAKELLRGIQQAVIEEFGHLGEGVPLSFSAGITHVRDGMDFEDAVGQVDRNLYQAKLEGRNRIASDENEVEKKRPTILVADDDEMIAQLVRHRLEREGFDVLHEANGKAALERAMNENDLSLILLDIKMPMLDGFQVLKRLRDHPLHADTPILLLTSMGNEQDIIRGFNLGATDYMTKPFSPRELAARIIHHLKRRV